MKVFQSSIFRALCAIVVGALLVKYREQTVTWITIAIGVIFFVSGVISTVAYLSAKRQATKEGVEIYDAKGNRLTRPVPPFPIVGIGSIILGAWLALFPNSFVNGLMFVLAGMLILGALNLFFNLAAATRFSSIGCLWWVLPVAIFLVGITALVKPSTIASAPLFIIGWGMMAYGMVDLVNTIKIHRCRKAFEKAQQGNDEADVVTIEEITDEPEEK
ncbi:MULTISPECIES: DUF308 domain-containing protein [Hallella]|uniref:DUF308 domain-containing protein n=2 Tax=Hallella TaxID=52228 RepID=A0ABV1FMF4_9BACT|nr:MULTISPECIES: DUF308 domain-containing protein [Hallella]MCI7433631.1 DUF308 domain-containing protein [Prevotella sp.]MBU0288721.1 DUF308 domain-containing protein [Hallella faecis]MDR3845303.1 DUF308 domain-containing protein [Hallella sp.]MDR4000633.1 DUF308 domain-containing protein [Hallella sp.]MDY5924595.1 DUF308 domain-containing protein [Hallella sp.]